jgi:hypothetical protein
MVHHIIPVQMSNHGWWAMFKLGNGRTEGCVWCCSLRSLRVSGRGMLSSPHVLKFVASKGLPAKLKGKQ